MLSLIDFSILLLWQLFPSSSGFLLLAYSGGCFTQDFLWEGGRCSCFMFFLSYSFCLSMFLSFSRQSSSSFSRSFLTACCLVKCLEGLNSVSQKLLLECLSCASSWQERNELLEAFSCQSLASLLRSSSIYASMCFSLLMDSGSVRKYWPSMQVATHCFSGRPASRGLGCSEWARGVEWGWLRWESRGQLFWDCTLESLDIRLMDYQFYYCAHKGFISTMPHKHSQGNEQASKQQAKGREGKGSSPFEFLDK